MTGSPASGTMSVLVLRAQVAGALALGIALDDLAEKVGLPRDAITPELLADPDARVPARVVLRLWETLPAFLPDRSFGLWLAELTRDAPLSAAWWVIHTSPNLGEGLARAVRFQRLLHDRARGELVVEAGETRYRHRIGDEAFHVPREAVEFGFASLVNLARRATGKPVTPKRTSFRQSAPADTTAHRALFGEVAFGAEVDEIVFDRASLALPLITHEPALREIVESHARALLAGLPPDEARTAARVRAMLAEAIRGRSVSLDAIAKRLGMPRRTLQRRLRDEGTTFDALLDDVRRDLAQRYLGDARMTVQETAFLLGFSDVAAFHRAFVRWTGKTPARYRLAR
ncbi:MAG: AraC family transcriptional regulator [Polyangiales bacterium]